MLSAKRESISRRSLMQLDPLIEEYLQSVALMSQSRADTYRFRLYPFVHFLQLKKTALADLLSKVKADSSKTYSFLGEYASHLQTLAEQSNGQGAASIKRRVNVVKLLLIFHDVDINEIKFKTKVRLPRSIRRDKEPIDKNDIRRIMLACDDKRVKTYLLLLSCTGMRAKEALYLRFSDFNLEKEPARVYLKGEYTKTRSDRFVFLTKEFVKQFEDYKAWRHRERRVYFYDKKRSGQEVIFTPKYRPDDLVFALPHRDESKNAAVGSLYKALVKQVNSTVDSGSSVVFYYLSLQPFQRIQFCIDPFNAVHVFGIFQLLFLLQYQ